MPSNIHPIREFVVRPALPPQLSRMQELANNILWAWEPPIRALFRRLDPAMWKESGYNPVVMLGRIRTHRMPPRLLRRSRRPLRRPHEIGQRSGPAARWRRPPLSARLFPP